MSAIDNVIFYNTFWNKKVVFNSSNGDPKDDKCFWPGLSWNPPGYPQYPNGVQLQQGITSSQWMIEESRIAGGYNNTQVEIGVQAFLNETEIIQRHRFNTLIHSGIYNDNTGVNETNVFSVAESITKSVEPSYGPIKRTQSNSSNLLIFQENKVSQALIDKDVIYTSEDGTATQPPGVVLGQVIPYVGEFGISCNPESFAQFGMRKYFADAYRGSVLRLSRDGLTEISQYGMSDYFRDKLRQISCNNRNFSISLTTDVINGILVSGSGVLTSSITQNTQDAVLGTNISVSFTCSNPNASGAVITVDTAPGPQSPVGTGEVTAVNVSIASGEQGSGYQVGNTLTIPKEDLESSEDVIITLTSADISVLSNVLTTDDTSEVRIGMTVGVEQANGTILDTGLIVTDVNYDQPYSITLSGIPSIADTSSGTAILKLNMPVRDKIIGGWDIHDRVYVLSLQNAKTSSTEASTYATLTFDETVKGWNSFYTYQPSNIFSLKDNYFTTFSGTLWKHHDETVINNRGNFYNVYEPAYIEFIFNVQPSIKKVFQTVNYEGFNGWEVLDFNSDETGANIVELPQNGVNPPYTFFNDKITSIKSYEEGLYIDPITGQPLRAGFDRKENLYVANLLNNTPPSPGEIIFGSSISGIKGYFATAKIQTDATTNTGGIKELFCVGTKFVKSS